MASRSMKILLYEPLLRFDSLLPAHGLATKGKASGIKPRKKRKNSEPKESPFQRGAPQDLDPTQIALAMSLETEPFPNPRTSRWSPTERELTRFASAIPPAHLAQPDSAVSGGDIELQTLSPQRGRLKRRGAGNRRPSDPNPKATRTLERLKEASRAISGRRAGYPTELMSEGRGTQPSQSSYQSQPRAGPSESQNQPSQPGPSVARKRQGGVADRDGDGRSVKHRVTVCNNEENRMDTLSPLLDKSR